MDGPVGNRCQLFVVGHDDKGLSELIAQIEEELVEFFLVFRVKGARGFVGKDDSRVIDEGTGYGYTLFLTPREFVGLMSGAFSKSHEIKQFLGSLLGLSVRQTSNIGGNHDVLDSCKLREQLVELEHEAQMLVAEIGQFLGLQVGDVDAVNLNGTSVRPVKRADDLKQGGLARSRGTYNTDHLALVDMEVDAFQYLQRAEALGDIFNIYHL